MPLEGYGGNGTAGTKGDRGNDGAAGAQGPTVVGVSVPATLTTSQGTVRILSPFGALPAAKTLAANSIKIHFGTGYSASDSSNWLWTPGYVTPGSPGSFTAIGSGRRNNVAGGAAISMSTETYSHSQVTIPQGAIPAVTCAPTNFPSGNAGPGETVFVFFNQ